MMMAMISKSGSKAFWALLPDITKHDSQLQLDNLISILYNMFGGIPSVKNQRWILHDPIKIIDGMVG